MKKETKNEILGITKIRTKMCPKKKKKTNTKGQCLFRKCICKQTVEDEKVLIDVCGPKNIHGRKHQNI